MIKVRDAFKPSVFVTTEPHIDWRDAQQQVEEELARFLCVPDTHKVIYLNRATAGFSALCWYLFKGRGMRHVGWEKHQYCSIEKIMNQYFVQNPRASHKLIVNWAGCAPEAPRDCTVYDCAQSCHQYFFNGTSPTSENYFLFSFESSKPMGSPAGGGALVVPNVAEEPIRTHSMPYEGFYNPRTEQCRGTYKTLQTFHQMELNKYWDRVRPKHAHLTGLLSQDFEVVSARTVNPTPTMCLLKPKSKEAKDKLKRVAKENFEVRECFNGLIAIPTYHWSVIKTLTPEYPV